jgi:hypothetical protein
MGGQLLLHKFIKSGYAECSGAKFCAATTKKNRHCDKHNADFSRLYSAMIMAVAGHPSAASLALEAKSPAGEATMTFAKPSSLIANTSGTSE